MKGVNCYYPTCCNRQTTNTSGLTQKKYITHKAKMGVSDQCMIFCIVMNVLCIFLGLGVFYMQLLDGKGHKTFIGKGRYESSLVEDHIHSIGFILVT